MELKLSGLSSKTIYSEWTGESLGGGISGENTMRAALL